VNQLILRLLPLALPPHASNPYLYARGISNFLPIYSAFENPLRSLHSLVLPHHVIPVVHRLYIHGLERSSSLEHDLKVFSSRPDLRISQDEDTACDSEYRVNDRPRLRQFVNHISAAVDAKPHVLLAYTWVFYMALFAGGRYIRGKLLKEEGFWARGVNAIPAGGAGAEVNRLSFWDFPLSTHDGEDLKTEFKARVHEIEPALSPAEREDIIQEAVEIMRRLLEVVHEIDRVLRKESIHQDGQLPIASIIPWQEKLEDVVETPREDGAGFLMEISRLMMRVAAGVLTRTRSFFSSSGESPTMPAAVAVKLSTE
jgi:heme oxygenase